jgi:hypothetical protein
LLRRISRILAILVLLLVAIAVICRAAGAARERQTAEQAAPSSGHFVLAGDLKMYVQEAGPSKGMPIVLLHGTGAWSEIWRETMTALAHAGFRAIAIDVPPFGYSGKPSGPSAYSPRQTSFRRIAAAPRCPGLSQGRRRPLGGSEAHDRDGAAGARPDRASGAGRCGAGLWRGGSTQFQQNDPRFS